MQSTIFEELKGKTLVNIKVKRLAVDKDDEIIFTTDTGDIYRLYHYQD